MLKPKETALRIAQFLDERKGEDITILKVDHLTSVTDYFVIVTARSAQAVHALYEHLYDEMREKEAIDPRRTDGVQESRWIVMDYASVIVHIFHTEEREYYNLERLWMDGSNQIPFVAQK